jgi:hypothetical protein
MPTRAFALTYTPYVTRIIALCAIGIALSLFLYGIFLLEAVAHTAARAEAESSAVKVGAQLASLEMEYLEYARALTPQDAVDLGYTEPVAISTVYAATSILTLGEEYSDSY